MMYASVYGRLGKDAKTIQTKTGKPMTAASLAVDVSARDEDSTLWVRVVAFGKLADLLAKHTKGDSVAASGRMELQHWTGEDGTERESWSLIADALHSSRTVRPGGGKKGARGTNPAAQTPNKPQTGGDGAPFNDELRF